MICDVWCIDDNLKVKNWFSRRKYRVSVKKYISLIFDGDGFSKRLWSPGVSSYTFLSSHFDKKGQSRTFVSAIKIIKKRVKRDCVRVCKKAEFAKYNLAKSYTLARVKKMQTLEQFTFRPDNTTRDSILLKRMLLLHIVTSIRLGARRGKFWPYLNGKFRRKSLL